MGDISEEVTSLIKRTGMKCSEFAAKFHLNEFELSAWLSGTFAPSGMKLFCIEQIVDLVEKYGDDQYKWIDSSLGILTGP